MSAKDPIDVHDFKFIAHSKLQIFENCYSQCSQPSLLCAASRFGLVFAAYLNNVKAIQLSSIINSCSNDKKIPVRTQQLNGNISHLILNCDHTILAISLVFNGASIIQFYDVTSYYKQIIVLINEVRLPSSPIQISWNPCIANVVAATLQDGSLMTCELVNNALNLNSTENNVQAMSLSWSPKGKQIVIGTQIGTLCQFKPDLKLVKSIGIPDVKGAIISVQWLSNYQFATVIHDFSNSSNVPYVFIVNAPKSGPVCSINYEEVCYNSREEGSKYVSFTHQQSWNVLFVLSLNSTEVGVLGGVNAQDACNWQPWILADDGRAEIPLVGKDESYPCGLALDTGNTKQITIGENETLPPMPMVHLLTDRGFLISFNVLNMRHDCPSICCPPEPIRDGSGLSCFVMETEMQQPVQSPNQSISQPTPIPVNPTISQAAAHGDISFLMNKPAITSTPAKPVEQRPLTFQAKPEATMFGKPAAVSLANNEKILDMMQSQSTANTSFSTNLFGSNAAPTSTSASLFSVPIQPIAEPPPPSTAPIKAMQPTMPTEPTSQRIEPKPSALQTSLQAPESEVPQLTAVTTGTNTLQNEEDRLNQVEDSEENKEAILNLIQTETNYFYKDFKDIIERSRSINIQCGTETESNLLYAGISDLKDFLEEANDSTQNQHSEVQALRQTLMEAYSWISEAKCKFASANHDSSLYSFEHIQHAADLDLHSKHQLSAITKLLYYVESQITQLNKQIDEQWSDFQDKCKSRAKGGMHIPSMESLYQTLLKQGDILSRQRELVEEILIKLKKKPSGPHYTDSSGKVAQLTNLLSDMKVTSQDFSQVQRERVLSLKSQYTKSKQAALLKVLSNHSTIKSIPVKINFHDCKSSMVLDRIKNIKEKKLKPSVSASKSIDFKTQLNEYMEKQTLLNQQNTNVGSVPKNLSNVFAKEAKKSDATFTIGNNLTAKNTFEKPISTEMFNPPSYGMTQNMIEKPKPTITSAPSLNLPKPVTKLTENAFSAPQPAQPVPTFKTGFSSISAPTDHKSMPATTSTASAFSVITPSFKPNQINFGARPVLEQKPEQSSPTLSLGGNSTSLFRFPAPSTQTSFTKPAASSGLQITKEKSSFEPAKEAETAPAGNNNMTFSFTQKPNTVVRDGLDNSMSDSANSIFGQISKAVPLNKSADSNNQQKVTDSVTITPITIKPSESSLTPTSSSFSFITASADKKNVDQSSKLIATSSADNTFKPAESTKPAAAATAPTNEANIPATSAQSVFTFSLEGDTFNNTVPVSSSNESIPPTLTQAETSVLDLKICSPSSDPKAATSKPSIFGMSSAASSASTAIAAAVPASTATSTFSFSNNSMFGGSAFGAKNSQTSIFGGVSDNKGNTDNLANASNIFQQANKMDKPTANIFGGAATTTSTGSAFGSGSIFGTSSAQQKPLEMSKSTFDVPSSGSNNVFGSPSKPETNIFGGGPLKPATAMFGQQPTFGGAATSGGSIFGGAATSTPSTSGIGFGSPTANTAAPFGGASTGFGSGSSIFGGGAFSSGGGSVAQGGFGSPLSIGKPAPGGFGSPPTFGSSPTAAPSFGTSPTFGSQASFGASPAFGSSATFGSPTNAFTNVPQPTGFAAQAQQSNTFENLASSNVISFGNLAQGSGTPQQPKPASFSGSSSFSSWR